MHATSLKKSAGYSFINTCELHRCRSCRYLPLVTALFGCFGGGFQTVHFSKSGRCVCSDCEVRTQPKLVKTCFAFQGTLVCSVCVFIHLCHVWQGYKKLICFQCHFLMYPFPWHCLNALLLRWHLFSRLPFFSFDVFPIWTTAEAANCLHSCVPIGNLCWKTGY